MRVERFTVPCHICGKPMEFTSENPKWREEVKPILERAFSDWVHIECRGGKGGSNRPSMDSHGNPSPIKTASSIGA